MSSTAWHCLECGGQADLSTASLDRSIMLGVCQDPLRPCGRERMHRSRRVAHFPPTARRVVRLVPVTSDLDQLSLAQRHRAERHQRQAHARHLASGGRLISSCPHCQALRAAQGVRRATS